MTEAVTTGSEPSRLWSTIEARLSELGLTSDRARQIASGVSPQTWDGIRTGRHIPRPDRLRAIEAFLGWSSGDIDRILADPQFRPVRPATLADIAEQITLMARRVEDLVDQVADLRTRQDEVARRRSGPRGPSHGA